MLYRMIRKKFFCLIMVLMLAVGQVAGMGQMEPVCAKAKPALNRIRLTLRVGGRASLKLLRWKKRVKWSSSKKSVATVSSKGVVRAKGKGTAKITAKAGSKKYVCRVSVTAKKAKKATTKAQPQASGYASEVLNLVNEERKKNGLPGLVLDQKLCSAADQRAKEIASLFSHTRPDGTSCFTVLKEYGISYRACGENIAAGYATAQEVVNGWMNSPGHRANILSDKFGALGVGCVVADKPYWVQLFTNGGSSASTKTMAPAATPKPTASAPPVVTPKPTASASPTVPANAPAATEIPASPTEVPTSPTEAPAPTPDQTSSYAQQVLELVNVERIKEGLGPLALDETLCAAADARAQETIRLFSHTRPDGTDCFTVLDEFAIRCNAAGENIAAGYPTAAAVVNGWMNSEGHRANILSSSFHKLGVGFASAEDAYGFYWTQLFTD